MTKQTDKPENVGKTPEQTIEAAIETCEAFLSDVDNSRASFHEDEHAALRQLIEHVRATDEMMEAAYEIRFGGKANWRSILKRRDTWTPTHLPESAYHYPDALAAYQEIKNHDE